MNDIKTVNLLNVLRNFAVAGYQAISAMVLFCHSYMEVTQYIQNAMLKIKSTIYVTFNETKCVHKCMM